jgi:predicted anti-sigma-YlaC factor YlaD
MNHSMDNVRPLICPQVVRHRRGSGFAEVIELYPRARRRPSRWFAWAVLAVLVSVMIGGALIIALRNGVGVTYVVPHWPGW